MKSIGCRCYKLGRYYYNYKELSTEEKIKRLIKVSIDFNPVDPLFLWYSRITINGKRGS